MYLCCSSVPRPLAAADESDMHSLSVIVCNSIDALCSSHNDGTSALPTSVSLLTQDAVWLDIERNEISCVICFCFFLSLCSLRTLHTTHHPNPVIQPTRVHPGGPAEYAQRRTPGGDPQVPLAVHTSRHGTAPQPSLC